MKENIFLMNWNFAERKEWFDESIKTFKWKKRNFQLELSDESTESFWRKNPNFLIKEPELSD